VGSFRQALNRTLVLPGFWYARTGVLDGKVRQRSRLGQHDHKANQKDMNLEPVGLFFDLAAMKSRCGVQVATHMQRVGASVRKHRDGSGVRHLEQPR